VFGLLKGVNGKDVTDAGKDVGMAIAAMNPVAVDETSVDKTVIEKEMEIAKALILAEGKPATWLRKLRPATSEVLQRQYSRTPDLCKRTLRQLLNILIAFPKD